MNFQIQNLNSKVLKAAVTIVGLFSVISLLWIVGAKFLKLESRDTKGVENQTISQKTVIDLGPGDVGIPEQDEIPIVPKDISANLDSVLSEKEKLELGYPVEWQVRKFAKKRANGTYFVAYSVVDKPVDRDNDRLSDEEENQYGTNSLSSDSDGDGLQDNDEIISGTNPLKSDSDDDGVSDGVEDGAKTDPLDPRSF